MSNTYDEYTAAPLGRDAAYIWTKDGVYLCGVPFGAAFIPGGWHTNNFPDTDPGPHPRYAGEWRRKR